MIIDGVEISGNARGFDRDSVVPLMAEFNGERIVIGDATNFREWGTWSVYDLLVEFLNVWTDYLVEKTRYPDMEYCTNVIMLVDSKWQCTTHIVRKIKTTVQSKL